MRHEVERQTPERSHGAWVLHKSMASQKTWPPASAPSRRVNNLLRHHSQQLETFGFHHSSGEGIMQSNSDVVRGVFEKVLNLGDIDAAGEFFWEDMVEQVPLPGQGLGLEGLKDASRGLRTAFPDMHWKVQEQVAEGAKVVSRFEWTGTHRGTFLGVPATDRLVTIWGMVIDRLEAGRIKDTRIIMDTLGLMMQLGVVTAPKA
jgi:steroid delta-isomerase-like uncharacterized protein